jgi:8-oxo-dGTP pyrophosphatase MutT (NUDIX family)
VVRIARFFSWVHPRFAKADQVAAVCFRMSCGGVEFLLVRTGNGRWTFPKGRTQPGLTRAQSAAIEAFEEAGVHGRIEEKSFTRYSYRKRRSRRVGAREELLIDAHLCEVSRAEDPQESRRNPTWFSAEKAKRKLRRGRAGNEGAELARVVELAVMRIGRVRSRSKRTLDTLQKVKFDAFEIAGTPAPLQHAAIRRYVHRENTMLMDEWGSRAVGEQKLLTGKVLPLKPRKA